MTQFSVVNSDYDRSYITEVLKTRMFGAFIDALKSRRDSDNMDQRSFANSLGTTDTNVSKLVAGPRNWQLSTIAGFLYALDLELEFAFVDKRNKDHIFTDSGEKYRNWLAEEYFTSVTQFYADNMQIPKFDSKLTNIILSPSNIDSSYNILEVAERRDDIFSENAGNFIYAVKG